LQLELVASRLDVQHGRLTGRLLGKNCHGEEKVKRIVERYPLNEYDEIYAYGDDHSDKPMLKLATHSFFRPFREKEAEKTQTPV
jgi:phosphatidylglycerophosphatase C